MHKSLNFTKAALMMLPPSQSDLRDVYRDTKVSGLELRVTKKGVKTFSVLRRVKRGEPGRITLGRFPDLTIEQARTKATEINAMIATGGNPADAIRDSRQEFTLQQAFDEYVSSYLVPQRKKTVSDIQDNFKRYLSGLAGKKLSAIKQSDIRDLVNKFAKNKKHATANRTLELLRAVFNKAILWKRFKGENPAVGIEKFKLKSRERFIQGDELPRFFKALEQTENILIRDFVLVSLLTGARRANVMAMRWDEISFDRAEWRILMTKNGTPQTVILTPEALSIIESRRGNGSHWVFPGDGETGHLVSPKKGWKSLLDHEELTCLEEIIRSNSGEVEYMPMESIASKLAKSHAEAKRLNLDVSHSRLADLRIHDLRRTMGSWQAKTGASLVIIGKSLNHQSLEATKVYARLDDDPVRESMQLATDAMKAKAGVNLTWGAKPPSTDYLNETK